MIRSILSGFLTATASISLSVFGYLGSESLMLRADAAPAYYPYPAAKALGLQPEQFPNSANVEFFDKAFLAFNNGNCVNVNIYDTQYGTKHLVGETKAVKRCQRAMRAGSEGTPIKNISYFPFGKLAISEVVHQQAWDMGITRSQISFVPYLGYIEPRW